MRDAHERHNTRCLHPAALLLSSTTGTPDAGPCALLLRGSCWLPSYLIAITWNCSGGSGPSGTGITHEYCKQQNTGRLLLRMTWCARGYTISSVCCFSCSKVGTRRDGTQYASYIIVMAYGPGAPLPLRADILWRAMPYVTRYAVVKRLLSWCL